MISVDAKSECRIWMSYLRFFGCRFPNYAKVPIDGLPKTGLVYVSTRKGKSKRRFWCWSRRHAKNFLLLHHNITLKRISFFCLSALLRLLVDMHWSESLDSWASCMRQHDDLLAMLCDKVSRMNYRELTDFVRLILDTLWSACGPSRSKPRSRMCPTRRVALVTQALLRDPNSSDFVQCPTTGVRDRLDSFFFLFPLVLLMLIEFCECQYERAYS